MSTVNTAPIVITSGEPAGIGPDIVLMLAEKGFTRPTAVIGNCELFRERAAQLGLNTAIESVSAEQLATLNCAPGTLCVLDVPLAAAVAPGQLNAANGQYVIHMLDMAINLAMNGKASAIVTGRCTKA